jgi:hypothetical protein
MFLYKNRLLKPDELKFDINTMRTDEYLIKTFLIYKLFSSKIILLYEYNTKNGLFLLFSYRIEISNNKAYLKSICYYDYKFPNLKKILMFKNGVLSVWNVEMNNDIVKFSSESIEHVYIANIEQVKKYDKIFKLSKFKSYSVLYDNTLDSISFFRVLA